MTRLRRYLIERELPGAGGMSIVELCGASRASNAAIEKLQPTIQWVQSYVAGDRIFCVYLADNEQTIHAHSDLSGVPVHRVTEIVQIIDPLTANN